MGLGAYVPHTAPSHFQRLPEVLAFPLTSQVQEGAECLSPGFLTAHLFLTLSYHLPSRPAPRETESAPGFPSPASLFTIPLVAQSPQKWYFTASGSELGGQCIPQHVVFSFIFRRMLSLVLATNLCCRWSLQVGKLRLRRSPVTCIGPCSPEVAEQRPWLLWLA